MSRKDGSNFHAFSTGRKVERAGATSIHGGAHGIQHLSTGAARAATPMPVSSLPRINDQTTGARLAAIGRAWLGIAPWQAAAFCYLESISLAILCAHCRSLFGCRIQPWKPSSSESNLLRKASRLTAWRDDVSCRQTPLNPTFCQPPAISGHCCTTASLQRDSWACRDLDLVHTYSWTLHQVTQFTTPHPLPTEDADTPLFRGYTGRAENKCKGRPSYQLSVPRLAALTSFIL
jgi:hypothetical protein